MQATLRLPSLRIVASTALIYYGSKAKELIHAVFSPDETHSLFGHNALRETCAVEDRPVM